MLMLIWVTVKYWISGIVSEDSQCHGFLDIKQFHCTIVTSSGFLMGNVI